MVKKNLVTQLTKVPKHCQVYWETEAKRRPRFIKDSEWNCLKMASKLEKAITEEPSSYDPSL